MDSFPGSLKIYSVVLAFLLFSGFLLYLGYSSTDESKPNIVLVTMESTRADHIGPCYGYDRNTAPNICNLSEDSVKFSRAYSHAPFTLPSLTSLMVSENPRKIGTTTPRSNLSEKYETIAESLKKKGYSTHAVVRSPFTDPEYGMDQGFETYSTGSERTVEQSRKAVRIVKNSEKPFFLWVHLYAPHQGYNPPEEFSGIYSEEYNSSVSSDQVAEDFFQANLSENDIEYIRSRYDEYLEYSDYSLGKLIEGLKEEEVYRDSMIVYTADHGEDLMDHGVIGHGYALHEPVVNVPLMLKMPGNQYSGDVVEEAVGLKDIFPTIREVLGEETGYSLLDAVKGEKRDRVISQMYRRNALIGEKWKLIFGKKNLVFDRQEGETLGINRSAAELYNLQDSRREKENLFNEKPRLGKKLLEKLENRTEEGIESEEGMDLDPGIEDRLEELGYIDP